MIGKTTCDTVHGNHPNLVSLPEGTRVRLRLAHTPSYSKIMYWGDVINWKELNGQRRVLQNQQDNGGFGFGRDQVTIIDP